MKTFSLLPLVLAFLLATPLHATTNLQRTVLIEEEPEEPQRNLQLINAELLNAVISTYFEPALDNILQAVLGYSFDPIYGLGYITGLSSMDIAALELVEGSEDIRITMTGGATWNGTWLINATLDDLTAETGVTIQARACGIPISEKVIGRGTIHMPSIQASMTLGGETDNLALLSETTNVTVAEVESLNFQLGRIEAGITLGEGSLIPDIDLWEEEFDGFVLNAILNDLEPRIVARLNEELDSQIPLALSEV